jgi:hypothetical protein
MESRGKLSTHRRADPDPVEEVAVKPRVVVYNEFAQVMVRNDSGGTIKVKGIGTGKDYIFEPGAIQTIDNKDKEYLLSLGRNNGCAGCGGSGRPVPYFSVVEG